jgi:hypothetical protein
MVSSKESNTRDHVCGTPTPNVGHDDTNKDELSFRNCTLAERLNELGSMPRRHAAIHWVAFTLSLLSFILLLIWIPGSPESVPSAWVWIDIGLGVIFAVEFFTRSGFRWRRTNYLRTHFFDFVAIVPALVIVNHGFIAEGAVVWIILVARFARVVDRLLGDGFVTRNVLALIDGFEEEITDRVMERIIARFQANVDQAHLSRKVAESLERNKDDVLQRVKAVTPRKGLVPGIAHVIGLDAALERAEERAYDAVIEIMNSEEMDRAIRDTINSSFASLRNEMGKRTWRQHLGIRSSSNK